MIWPSSSLSSVFDLILFALFPLAILLAFFRLARDGQWSQLRDLCFGFSTPDPFSLTRAYLAYAQYAKLSANELCAMRASYASLGRAHKRLGNKIGYAAKLDRLKYVTDLNSTITDGIVEMAEREYNLLGGASAKGGAAAVNNGDLARVREALRHFVRDWSAEGAGERETTFAPILEVLKAIPPSERAKMSVLVPGCGLGRLAWEISELGLNTTANELSYFMVLAFRFLVSSENTTMTNEHAVRPYAHWFSHQRSNDTLFRKVTFPDVVPRLSSKLKLVEGDFLKLDCLERTKSSSHGHAWNKQSSADNQHDTVGYDYIVTLFFIDTSPNVLLTMEHIYDLLKPGGAWINLGPLLWTSGGQTKLELSLGEVLAAAREIGFIDDPSIEQRSVECEYTSDPLAMMRWTYKAEFWTMRKPI